MAAGGNASGRTAFKNGQGYARSAHGMGDPIVRGGAGVKFSLDDVVSTARRDLASAGLNRFTGRRDEREREKAISTFVTQQSYRAGLASASGQKTPTSAQINRAIRNAVR